MSGYQAYRPPLPPLSLPTPSSVHDHHRVGRQPLQPLGSNTPASDATSYHDARQGQYKSWNVHSTPTPVRTVLPSPPPSSALKTPAPLTRLPPIIHRPLTPPSSCPPRSFASQYTPLVYKDAPNDMSRMATPSENTRPPQESSPTNRHSDTRGLATETPRFQLKPISRSHSVLSSTSKLDATPVSASATEYWEDNEEEDEDDNAEEEEDVYLPQFDFHMAGLHKPKKFPFRYPAAFLRQDPIKTKSSQGQPSQNPWDYLPPAPPDPRKPRRRFTRKELQFIEVVWYLDPHPTTQHRQRLGAWLGIRSKHLTVWFQNRRQETKRHLAQTASSSPAPTPNGGRGSKGTYDPSTGKRRPVPASCVSGAQRPNEMRQETVRKIFDGEMNRDHWFSVFPPGETLEATAPSSGEPSSERSLGRTISGALEQVLDAREIERSKRRSRRDTLEMYDPEAAAEERNDKLLNLMSSSLPPTPEKGDAASNEENEDTDSDEIIAPQPHKQLVPKRGTIGRTASLGLDGRATSQNVLLSSMRARQLTGPMRSVSGPVSITSSRPATSLDAYSLGISEERPVKRVRTSSTTSIRRSAHFCAPDSFSRSSAVVDRISSPATSESSSPRIKTPTSESGPTRHEEEKDVKVDREVMDVASVLCGLANGGW